MYHITLKAYDMTKFYTLPIYNKEIGDLLLWLNNYYNIYSVIKGEIIEIEEWRIDNLQEELDEIEYEISKGCYFGEDEKLALDNIARFRELTITLN